MKIRLHEPTFGEEEIQAVVEVMRTTNITSGEKVREFESKFGENAVMCNSGSSANLLAIAGLCYAGRLFAGDEVIVPALSWSTTVWPLIQHSLIPKVVDIDPMTLNIDVDQISAAVGPKTKGIMIVHVYGNPCYMKQITALCERHGLVLIEDCCEAIGACQQYPVTVGSYGDVATFSFYFSHHITTGEGGMVITKERGLAEQVRILRAHGWIRDMKDPSPHLSKYPDFDPKFLFVSPGYNLRCTEMQAAMGLIQIAKLNNFIKARRMAAFMYKKVFNNYDGVIQYQKENGYSSWFGFPLVINASASFLAGTLRMHLEAREIETRSIICGNIARQPGLKKYPHVVHGDLSHSDHVMKNGFSIGCHQNITDEHVKHLEQTMEMFKRSYA